MIETDVISIRTHQLFDVCSRDTGIGPQIQNLNYYTSSIIESPDFKHYFDDFKILNWRMLHDCTMWVSWICSHVTQKWNLEMKNVICLIWCASSDTFSYKIHMRLIWQWTRVNRRFCSGLLFCFALLSISNRQRSRYRGHAILTYYCYELVTVICKYGMDE